MRLIDADALPHYTGYALSADEVAMAVENAPTIDAVPVVRCRDCKFWQETPNDILVRKCNVRSGYSGDTDYCSYGERKDDEVHKNG